MKTGDRHEMPFSFELDGIFCFCGRNDY